MGDSTPIRLAPKVLSPATQASVAVTKGTPSTCSAISSR